MSTAVYTTEKLRTMAFENATAVMNCNHLWVTNYQSIVHSMELATQARLEQRWATWKSITDFKSPYRTALEVQSDMFRTAFQRSLTMAARMTKASFQVMGHAMQPMAAYMARPAGISSSLGA